MRRLALIVLLTTLAGCGGADGSEDASGSEPQAGETKQGLSMSVSFTEPLRTGQPVTWSLEVENGGPAEATLVFDSGKEGDVILTQGGKEAYRWSGTRYFTQAMRQVRLAPGEKKTFTLEEQALSAAAGDYELVAELDSEPAPPPSRRSVKIED
jgi:hypothetical protein